MNVCAAELKVSDWQMITWTSWSCGTVKGRRGMVDDRYVMEHNTSHVSKILHLRK